MLGLLDSIERDSRQSHRSLSSELGIALGLTNAYVKRCVKKGFLKIFKAKANYYAYYVTPRGFLEKSRLSAQYLSHSLSFFRHARGACAAALTLAASRGQTTVVLAGISDLAEIVSVCSIDSPVKIIAAVDRESSRRTFAGVPVFQDFDELPADFDGAIIVTDLVQTRALVLSISEKFGADRVIAPSLLDTYRRNLAAPPQPISRDSASRPASRKPPGQRRLVARGHAS